MNGKVRHVSSDSNYRLPKIDASPAGDLESQLIELYEEKRRLFKALGTADADAIIAMVRSLEAQLLDLYSSSEDVERG
ncbi:MAG: hypothetical protein AAFU77_17860 [Myxococcota bacterium]